LKLTFTARRLLAACLLLLCGCSRSDAPGPAPISDSEPDSSSLVEPVRRENAEGDRWRPPADLPAAFSLDGAVPVSAPNSPAELISLLEDRFGIDLHTDFRLPEGLDELRDLQVLTSENAVTLVARTTLLGTLDADVLIHAIEIPVPSLDDPAVEVHERSLVYALRPHGLELSNLVAGAPDIALPQVVLVSAPGLPRPVVLNERLIGREAARFYAPALGGDEASFEIFRGNNIAMALPLSVIPEIASEMMGIDRDELVLARGVLQGPLLHPAGLYVTSALPLPPGGLKLPDFMPDSGIDDLGLELASEAGDLVAKVNVDFHVALDGARRVFSGATILPVGRPSAGTLTLLANLQGAWSNPFGTALTLHDVGMVMNLGRTPGGELSGAFEFSRGGPEGELRIGLDAKGNTTFAASADRVDLEALTGFIDAQLGDIGAIPFPDVISELEDVALTFDPKGGGFRVGGRAPSVDVTIPVDGRTFTVDLGGYVAYADGFEASFEGALPERWTHPFGIAWMDLDDVILELGNTGGATGISVRSNLQMAGKSYELMLRAGKTGASMLARADEVSLDELIGFIERAVGEDPLALLGASRDQLGSLTDFQLELATGSSTAFSISARTQGPAVFGHSAEFMLSAIKEAGQTQKIAGLRLDDFNLGRLLGIPGSPALDALQFDSGVIVLATGDAEIDPARVGPAAKDFYHGLYTRTLEVRSGLSLLAALPVEKGSLVDRSLGFIGSDEESLILAGTIPLEETDPWSLEARLPRFSTLPLGDAPTPWFVWGQLAFAMEGEGSDVSVGLKGDMQVLVDGEPLTFGVQTSLSPESLTFTGRLQSESPEGWTPFPNMFPDLGWLHIKRTEVEMTVGPINALGFEGAAVIGSKEMAIDLELDPITPAGVPIGFGFKGTSQDPLAISDLLALQAEMARAADKKPIDFRPLLEGVPALELRPLDAETPLEVTFKATHDPEVALKGALFGAMAEADPKILLGSVRAEITPLKLDISGSSPHCIAFRGARFDPACSAETSDVYLNRPDVAALVNPVSFTPEAWFSLAGALHTPWFTTDVDLKYGGRTNVVSLIRKVIEIVSAFTGFVRDFAREPVGAVKTAVTDTAGLFTVSEVEPPQWFEDLFTAIDRMKQVSPKSEGRNLLQKALAGYPVPAGVSFALECPASLTDGIPTLRNGVCYARLPSDGTKLDKVCPVGYEPNGGDCLARQIRVPGVGCSKGWSTDGNWCERTRDKICPAVISKPIGNNCYLLTDLPREGKRAEAEARCPAVAPDRKGDRCYLRGQRLPGVCDVTDDIDCNGDVVGQLEAFIGRLMGRRVSGLLEVVKT